MRSIASRLTLWVGAGVAVAFVAAGLLLRGLVSDALVTQFDAALTAKAAALGSLLELERPGYIEFGYEPVRFPQYEAGEQAEWFALFVPDGTLAYRGGREGSDTLPLLQATEQAPRHADLVLPDGRAGRAVALVFPVAPDEDDVGPPDDPEEDLLVAGVDHPVVTLVVARPRTELDAQLAALTTGLLAAALAVLALVGWGVTWGVRRGLRPVRDLGDAVGSVDAASLSLRVPVDGVPAELLPFAVKLNELFERLQGAFDKERRMTAAMAHELRTPIAELRAASDVARTWPDDDTLVDELVATAGHVALRMSAAVEAVMRYCRVEAGQAVPEWERVPLRPLLDEHWSPYASAAAERGVTFVNEVSADATAWSDKGMLGLVFRNLLDNAASFAAPGEIVAQSRPGGLSVRLQLDNAAPELSAADVGHLREPFWRKDAARTGGRHSGLGLTLVTALAGILGAELDLAVTDGRYVVTLELPAEARHVAPDDPATRPAPAARG